MKERPIIFNSEMVRAILDDRKTQTRRVVKPQPPLMEDVVNRTGSKFSTAPATWSGRPDDYVICGPSGVVCEMMGVKNMFNFKCPYGKIGDRLWVRESIRKSKVVGPYGNIIEYCADGAIDPWSNWEWKRDVLPSIHMPFGFCRINLEVTEIRVERVQDITDKDAEAEGIVRVFTQEQCDTTVGIIGTKPEDHGWSNYLWHGHFGQHGDGNKQSDDWHYQCSGYKSARDSFSSLWEKINSKRGFGWDTNPWVWIVGFKRIDRSQK